jgi:hypothetical protein
VAFVTDKLRDDLELPELSPGFDPAHSTSAW